MVVNGMTSIVHSDPSPPEGLTLYPDDRAWLLAVIAHIPAYALPPLRRLLEMSPLCSTALTLHTGC